LIGVVKVVAIFSVRDGFPKVGTKAQLNPVVNPSAAWVMVSVTLGASFSLNSSLASMFVILGC
jgi:hypothetical protein